MSWTSRALINGSAVQHNLNVAKKNAENSQILAVIKSDAYGHGIKEISKILIAADGFAVATIQEAIRVREIHNDKIIVVLQGFLTAEQFLLIKKYKLQAVIHNHNQLDILESLHKSQQLDSEIRYWFKIDIGMGRLGFSSALCLDALKRLEQCTTNIIIMSHFPNADDPENSATSRQIKLFDELAQHHNYQKSLANSAGILGWHKSHYDWVRAGIMLYGVSPFKQINIKNDLKPVMTLQSRVIAITHHYKGDTIGYGSTWICPEDMNIAIVSIGYGDGYPRHAKAGTPVLIENQTAYLIGRVSMDMICIDMRLINNATVGSKVTLWGEQLPVETIAQHSNSIAYELLCQIGNRVEFVYH